MRKYSIGAMLLDLQHPERVIGTLREPLLKPSEAEREGYVPNVVYTCGALIHAGRLVIPYGISDTTTTIATLELDPIQAETIINATSLGKLSLALRSIVDFARTEDDNAQRNAPIKVIRYGVETNIMAGTTDRAKVDPASFSPAADAPASVE